VIKLTEQQIFYGINVRPLKMIEYCSFLFGIGEFVLVTAPFPYRCFLNFSRVMTATYCQIFLFWFYQKYNGVNT